MSIVQYQTSVVVQWHGSETLCKKFLGSVLIFLKCKDAMASDLHNLRLLQKPTRQTEEKYHIFHI